MRKEYDFKKGVRGRFFKPSKVQKTIRIDREVLDFYMRMAEQEGIPYQTLIGMTLRKFAREGGSLVVSTPPRRAKISKPRRSAKRRA